MYECILDFHILNYFFGCFLLIVTTCAKKAATSCPVRKVGESIRNNVVDDENSTKTAKAQRASDHEDKSTRTKKEKKKKQKEKEKEKLKKLEKTQNVDEGPTVDRSIAQASTQVLTIVKSKTVVNENEKESPMQKQSQNNVQVMSATLDYSKYGDSPMGVSKNLPINKNNNASTLNKKASKVQA